MFKSYYLLYYSMPTCMTSCLHYYNSFLSGLMAFILAISKTVWHIIPEREILNTRLVRIPSCSDSSNDLSFIQSKNKPYGQEDSVWSDSCLFFWPSLILPELSGLYSVSWMCMVVSISGLLNLLFPLPGVRFIYFHRSHSLTLIKFLPIWHFLSKNFPNCIIASSSHMHPIYTHLTLF